MDAGSSPAAGAPQCGKVDVAGHGGGCNNRASTLATLAEDSYEFTRLLPRSDLMDAVLRGDEAAMRNPVLNDTVELARSLWPNCSARPAGALIYYTVRPHATGTGSTPYFWGGSSRRPACSRWRQPSKAWHWTRSSPRLPEGERSTTTRAGAAGVDTPGYQGAEGARRAVAAPRAAEMLCTGSGVDSRWGGTYAAPI